MFFLATADATGQPQCSCKGGDPGFVRVVDAHTIAFPSYDGNGMFPQHRQHHREPARRNAVRRLRERVTAALTGAASIDPDDALLADFTGAKLVVRVRVEAVFPNCRRYVHTHGSRDRSVFVPVEGQAPAVPDWKRDPWFDGTLASGDPALDPERPSAPSIPIF